MKRSSLDAGRLRHRLRLEASNEVSDEIGGFSINWQLISNVWASIEPTSSFQISNIGNLQSIATHTISIRWRADCHPEMRFVKNSREFIIITVTDPDETRRYLRCKCEEVI